MHENHHGNHKIIGTFIVILIISATAYLSILSWNALKSRDYIGVSEEQRHSIRIDGIGKAIGTPDIAKIQLGYKAEKKTVAEAQTDNTEKMNTIIEKQKQSLKDKGKDKIKDLLGLKKQDSLKKDSIKKADEIEKDKAKKALLGLFGKKKKDTPKQN